MSKKSNKTSHVINLITNRTGLSAEELEQVVSPSRDQIYYESPPEVERIIEAPAERLIPAPSKRRLNVSEISGDISEAVSAQIRASLEIVEIQETKVRTKAVEDKIKAREAVKQARMGERAEMSMERLTKDVKPAITATRREEPQVETFAPENFNQSDESIEESAGDDEGDDEPQPKPAANTEPPAAPEPANKEEPSHERTVTTSSKSMEGLILANILEEVMRLEAPKIMKGLGMCCCERCLNDVLAIALNSIPPKYVVTQKGALFAKIASYGVQYQTDIFAHLTKACVTVGNSPSHS